MLDDHGWIMLGGRFEGEAWGQGFGYGIDAEFLKAFLGIWNLEYLSRANGKPCWVTHDSGNIYKVESLFPEEGEAFDVEGWARKLREEEKVHERGHS